MNYAPHVQQDGTLRMDVCRIVMDARQVSIVEFVNSPSLQFLSFITSGRIVIYYPQVVVDFLVTFTLYITNTLLLYTL